MERIKEIAFNTDCSIAESKVLEKQITGLLTSELQSIIEEIEKLQNNEFDESYNRGLMVSLHVIQKRLSSIKE